MPLSRMVAARCIRSTFLTRYSGIRRNMKSCCGPGETISVVRQHFGPTIIPHRSLGRHFRDSGRDGVTFTSGSEIIDGLKMMMAGIQHMLRNISSMSSVSGTGEQALRNSPRLKLIRYTLRIYGIRDKRTDNYNETIVGNSTADTNFPITSMQ